jgi:spermidine synthase
MTLRVALLLLGSGFCALVYQVAWLRALRLIFGGSTAASAAVLAIFMLGLGAGGIVLGKRADRVASPLRMYGVLELAIALLAAASPLLVLAARSVYLGLGGSEVLGGGGSAVVRLLLALLVLGAPTFLMGGTLPAAVRAVERAHDQARRRMGLLYAANTLGAVVGATWANFVSLEALGMRASLWTAAALNLGVALLALRLAKRGASEPEAPAAAAAPAQPAAASAPRAAAAPTRLVLTAAGLVGFAFLLMELVWYRMLAPLLGGSTYSFGLILAVALLGIGLGGLAYGFGPRPRRPTLFLFSATCAIEAALLVLPFALGDQIVMLAILLRPLGEVGFAPLVGTWALLCGIVVFPAAFVSGYQFPLLVALLGRGNEDVGRQVGLAYAWNTGGAILGSLAGGFGLLPLLTAPACWQLVAAVLVLLALAALVPARNQLPEGQRSTGRWAVASIGPVGVSVLAVLMLSAPGPSAAWRHTPVGAGRVRPDLAGENARTAWLHDVRRNIYWEAEGVESSIALDRDSGFALLVHGKSDGHAIMDAPTTVMLGLIPALAHPDPKRSMVIGLGTGTTAGWLAALPETEHVDAVELEATVFEAARACAMVNFGVMDHPKVTHIVNDAREVLLTTPERYDLVSSEPSNPYRAGVGSLFTREFYQAVSDRLTERGVLAQWVQGYEIDAGTFRTVVATLEQVFPHVEVWETGYNTDLLLLASKQPLVWDRADLERRLATEPYATALLRIWGVAGAHGLFSGFVANAELLDELGRAEQGRLNTDDRTLIEFDFARNVGQIKSNMVLDLKALARERGQNRPSVDGAIDWSLVDENVAQRAMARHGTPPPLGGAPDRQIRGQARRAYAEGEEAEAFELWTQQDQGPLGPGDLALLSAGLVARGLPYEFVQSDLERLSAYQPVEALRLRAVYSLARGDHVGATELAIQALVRLRSDPWVWPRSAERCLALVAAIVRAHPEQAPVLVQALGEPFALRFLDDARLRTRVELLPDDASAELCVPAHVDFEPWVVWDEEHLVSRADCYRRAGHPLASQAQGDLERFRSAMPPALERGL